MASKIIPLTRPKLTAESALTLAHKIVAEDEGQAGILSDFPVMLLGIRGYYRDTMGKYGVNDFGIFDDAGFLLDGETVTSFNWNCDPVRVGWNPGVGKNYAQLAPGVWPFRQGPHRGRPGHLRQITRDESKGLALGNNFWDFRARGEFMVRRVERGGDGGFGVGKSEIGYQAINIHEGTERGTGSWGCQTLPPGQWKEFSKKVYAAMDRVGQKWIPYVLTEERV